MLPTDIHNTDFRLLIYDSRFLIEDLRFKSSHACPNARSNECSDHPSSHLLTGRSTLVGTPVPTGLAALVRMETVHSSNSAPEPWPGTPPATPGYLGGCGLDRSPPSQDVLAVRLLILERIADEEQVGFLVKSNKPFRFPVSPACPSPAVAATPCQPRHYCCGNTKNPSNVRCLVVNRYKARSFMESGQVSTFSSDQN